MPLTAEQLERLKAVFPEGVCDYTRPGIGQEVTQTGLAAILRICMIASLFARLEVMRCS